MLKILGIQSFPDKEYQLAHASVLIGSDGENTGFKCNPNTIYRCSVQVRGNVSRAFIRGVEWKTGESLWKFEECKGSKQSFEVSQDWKTVQCVFKTGPEADHAALNLSIWWSSQWKDQDPHILKEGDYLLFDNVKIEEVMSDPKSGTAK